MAAPNVPVATFETVKEAKDNQNVLVIDVREPSELQETGTIPGSINIPLSQIGRVLNMPPEEFIQNYGRKKPDVNFPIIFSCRSGKRSVQALETAIKLGYKNVKNYSGGWLDWESKNV